MAHALVPAAPLEWCPLGRLQVHGGGLRLTGRPVLYAAGPFARLPTLLSSEDREALRQMENRTLARVPPPDRAYWLAFPESVRSTLLADWKPRLEPYRGVERGHLVQAGRLNFDLEGLLAFIARVLPGAIDRFVDRHGDRPPERLHLTPGTPRGAIRDRVPRGPRRARQGGRPGVVRVSRCPGRSARSLARAVRGVAGRPGRPHFAPISMDDFDGRSAWGGPDGPRRCHRDGSPNLRGRTPIGVARSTSGWKGVMTGRQRPTRRQLEVLRAYIRAGSVAAAAYELGISETTVRQYLSGLYRRWFLNAAQAAYRLGTAGSSSPSRTRHMSVEEDAPRIATLWPCSPRRDLEGIPRFGEEPSDARRPEACSLSPARPPSRRPPGRPPSQRHPARYEWSPA